MAMVSFCTWGAVLATAPAVRAASPQLYTQPFHQSTVRGEPGDLLTIAGANLLPNAIVVYRRLGNTNVLHSPPAAIPGTNTSDEGVAPVVSYRALPDNIVVSLPSEMLRGESYTLWLRTPSGTWTGPVKINDARPLWVTPSAVPPTGAVATLPRELKVVGRNLEPAPGRVTQVILAGDGVKYTMPAVDDGNDTTSIERYVAKVPLPASMVPGLYGVFVSRDGQSWVEVPNQQLTVTDAPSGGLIVDLASFGCRPDDSIEDRACFEAALAYLAPTGGVVHVGAGRWDLLRAPVADRVHGIVVPHGVSLRGDGSNLTKIVRGPMLVAEAVFTLLGRNAISGIFFEDEIPHTRLRNVTFQLGKRPSATGPAEPQVIEDVTFTGNLFRRMYNAIGGGGLPVRRLYIAGNEFQAFKDALFLDAFYLPHEPGAPRFRLDDSIVRQNLFRPGDYYEPDILQGTIATQIGASTRVDFSENVADGHRYGPPSSIPPGWRAAFFFHQTNNHEKLLISQNQLSCTGDKAGDGEAIAFDFARNSYAFDEPSAVISASADRVRIRGALLDWSPEAFSEHWVQIVDGTGLGQSRKIIDYVPYDFVPEVEFIVSPPWDAVPLQGSTAVVTRQFWQTYVVDNTVDIRGCTKQNANWKKSGQFTIWAQTSDSAIDGNAHYESDGIWIYAGHSRHLPEMPEYPPTRRVHFSHFVDIRENRIYDEYEYPTSHWKPMGSFSGIQLLYWTLSNQVPAQSGYAISIAHNRVVHADGYAGGGIAIFGAWFSESFPPTTPIQYRSVLVDRNQVSDIQCANAGCIDEPVRRIGIHIQNGHAHDTVLHANHVLDCHEEWRDFGTDTTHLP
jgi:hypothetical protein